MKKILLIIFSMIQFSILSAEKIPQELAEKAVYQLLTKTNVFINAPNGVYYSIDDKLHIIRNDVTDEIIAYVFYLNPSGFVVVSADYGIDPILAYSNNSEFKPSENPDDKLLFLIKKDIKLWKRAIKEGKITTDSYNQKWETIKKVNRVKKQNQSIQVLGTVFGPHLSSQWGQGTVWNSAIGEYERVYNIYTPNHWAVGCNATAMVQILNYYKWPLTGNGSHTYSENGRNHSIDYYNTTYEWDNTLDIYKGVITTQEQKNNVSLISYHGAVSIDMDFGETGSTSNISDVPTALANYFRFIGHYETVSGYPNFFTRLQENMESMHPTHLAISNETAVGHAVVCDGYDSNTNFYHLNMGWSGSSDAWYNITGSFNAGGYTAIDAAVFDILPEPEIISIVADEHNPLEITINWIVSDNLNIDMYELQRKDGISGTWETINNSITTTSYTETLSSEGSYYYRVRAKVDGHWYLNSYSNEMLFSTISNNDYRTKQSGNWTSLSTWEVYNGGWVDATSYPTSSDGVTSILSGYEININANITTDQIIIYQNAKVIVKTGNDLSINNGPGTDLIVNGTLRKEGTGRILYVGGGTTTSRFNSGSLFQLAGTNKYILVADWDPNSTLEISGAIGGDMTATYHTDQAFGNFIWNATAQTSNVYFSGNLTNIQGDFNLKNTNGFEFRLTGSAGDDPTVTVKGDVNIENGILNLTSGDNNIYLVCYGNFRQSNGEIKASGAGTGYLRFGPISGGGYSGSFSNSSGVFSPDNIQVNSSFNLTLNSDMNISNSPLIINGILNTQDYIIYGSGSFTLSSSARLITGHTNGLDGTLQTSGVSLDPDADFEYSGIAAQVTGSLLPTSITDGLIINNSTGVTLSQNTNISGGKTGLVLSNGKLITATDKVIVLGTDGYWSRGNDNSFVNGPLTRTFNSSVSTAKSFPIGKENDYRKIILTIVHDTDTPTMYTCEVFNQAPTTRTLPVDIDKVSTVRYWNIKKESGANIVEAEVNLSYNDNDGVTDPLNLRIVKDDGTSNWINIGGTGSSSGNGTISSTVSFTDFGDFTLANTNDGNNPVPVELTSFTVVEFDEGVLLNWTTATEVNNYGFEIERASSPLGTSLVDGVSQWETIGFVDGHGNSYSPKEYSFIDTSSINGEVYYRLKQIDTDGTFEYSEVVDVKFNKPIKYELAQNYPNPFNPSTTITYSIPSMENESIHSVQLMIYDILGRVIATLVNKKQLPGKYSVTWIADNIPSGNYFYKLKVGEFIKVKKMILLK